MGIMQTILVVDDEEDLRDMMAFQLKSADFNVVTAYDGVDALEKLKDLSPSLIILDLNMPRMGGIEVYQHLCEATGKPAYPVLILTARANTEQLFKDLDIDGFMAKPFEVDELVKEARIIIDKHLRLAPQEQKGGGILKTVYVADNEDESRDSIALALLNAGYRVASAKSGTSALEMFAAEPPELALVKLGLSDIPGDLVVLRARRMAKTSNIKFILFEPRDSRRIKAVRENIGNKSGILDLVESTAPDELLKFVDKAIQKGFLKSDD